MGAYLSSPVTEKVRDRCGSDRLTLAASQKRPGERGGRECPLPLWSFGDAGLARRHGGLSRHGAGDRARQKCRALWRFRRPRRQGGGQVCCALHGAAAGEAGAVPSRRLGAGAGGRVPVHRRAAAERRPPRRAAPAVRREEERPLERRHGRRERAGGHPAVPGPPRPRARAVPRPRRAPWRAARRGRGRPRAGPGQRGVRDRAGQRRLERGRQQRRRRLSRRRAPSPPSPLGGGGGGPVALRRRGRPRLRGQIRHAQARAPGHGGGRRGRGRGARGGERRGGERRGGRGGRRRGSARGGGGRRDGGAAGAALGRRGRRRRCRGLQLAQRLLHAGRGRLLAPHRGLHRRVRPHSGQPLGGGQRRRLALLALARRARRGAHHRPQAQRPRRVPSHHQGRRLRGGRARQRQPQPLACARGHGVQAKPRPAAAGAERHRLSRGSRRDAVRRGRVPRPRLRRRLGRAHQPGGRRLRARAPAARGPAQDRRRGGLRSLPRPGHFGMRQRLRQHEHHRGRAQGLGLCQAARRVRGRRWGRGREEGGLARKASRGGGVLRRAAGPGRRPSPFPLRLTRTGGPGISAAGTGMAAGVGTVSPYFCHLMGQYLSSPVTTKESEEGYADGVAFGMAAMQGWRVFMEDAHITELAYDSETQPPTSLFSVFDGHGGKGVALFAAKHLPKMLRETREYKSGDLSGALVAAYYEVDRLLRTPEGESEVVELSGSTHKGAGHQPSTLFGEVPDVLEAEASLASGAEEERAAAESGEEVPEARSSDFLQSHLMRASLISPSVTSRAPARVSPFPPSLFDAPSDPPSSAAGAEEGSPTPAGGAPSAAPEPPPPGAAPDRPSPRKPSTPGQPPKPPAPPSKGPPVSGEALGAQESGEALPSPRPSMLFPDVAPLELSPAPDPEALATLTSGGSQASSAMDRLDTVRYERDPAAQSPGSSAAGSSGCTALSVLVRGTQVLVANTGDSRCVLSRRGAAVALTLDHKPILFEEARRIIRAGGFVRDNRINGALNVSRAMGDLDFKANDRLPQGEQMVVVTPDVEVLRLADGDEFVILACDGIWDVLSNQEAVEFVRRRLKNGLGLKEIAEQMCDACLAPDLKGLCRGADNMSVVLVHFPKYARFDSFWKNVWGALWPEAALRQLVGKR